jgi:hypothetical protein
LLLQQAVGEDDLNSCRGGLNARRLALKLAGERDPAVYHRTQVIPVAEGIKRAEGHPDFNPQGTEDQLPSPRRVDRLHELDVFPGIDRPPIQRLVGGRQPLSELD